jgi:hypothetical protein
MSDHFPGPRAIADPAADIAALYVFPSPERLGHLVLVLMARRNLAIRPTRRARALFHRAALACASY